MPANQATPRIIDGDDGADVGLEQVGTHAGHVADVVAHVVGDGGRVERVVLGDPGLDLAHEVGADVGGLGVDAAAHAGEERDGRGAQREPGQMLRTSIITVVVEGSGVQLRVDRMNSRPRPEREPDPPPTVPSPSRR